MPKLDADRQLIGFDFGLKHIGVAVGQLITHTATALDNLHAIEGIPDWTDIDSLCRAYDIQAFVVGIPLNMDNTPQTLTLLAESFCQQLESRYHLPVYRCDERLSTVSAREELFAQGGVKALSKTNIDGRSAKIILEQWMSQQNRATL